MSQINDKDSVITIDRLIDKAEANIYMSAIVIAAEIDAVVEVYDKQGIRRDDILMGLEDILKATGKRIGGFL